MPRVCWANISPALGQRLVFDRLHDRKRWTKMNGTLTDRDPQTALIWAVTGKTKCLHLCVQRGDIIRCSHTRYARTCRSMCGTFGFVGILIISPCIMPHWLIGWVTVLVHNIKSTSCMVWFICSTDRPNSNLIAKINNLMFIICKTYFLEITATNL